MSFLGRSHTPDTRAVMAMKRSAWWRSLTPQEKAEVQAAISAGKTLGWARRRRPPKADEPAS